MKGTFFSSPKAMRAVGRRGGRFFFYPQRASDYLGSMPFSSLAAFPTFCARSALLPSPLIKLPTKKTRVRNTRVFVKGDSISEQPCLGALAPGAHRIEAQTNRRREVGQQIPFCARSALLPSPT